MKQFSFLTAWLAALLLTGCVDGAPGTPNKATVYIDGSASFFAGAGSSH